MIMKLRFDVRFISADLSGVKLRAISRDKLHDKLHDKSRAVLGAFAINVMFVHRRIPT